MPPLPSSVSLPAWPKSWSAPEPPVRVSLPAPPNRFAPGSAPFASLRLITSLPPRPKTRISEVLATVGVPPATATAPPLTRILPAALRLIAMLLAALSPKTVSTPVLNVAVVAALAGLLVAPSTPAASATRSAGGAPCVAGCWSVLWSSFLPSGATGREVRTVVSFVACQVSGLKTPLGRRYSRLVRRLVIERHTSGTSGGSADNGPNARSYGVAGLRFWSVPGAKRPFRGLRVRNLLPQISGCGSSGACRDRTGDLRVANAALSQLS